jgi:phenolic acid decarboxylase
LIYGKKQISTIDLLQKNSKLIYRRVFCGIISGRWGAIAQKIFTGKMKEQ